MFRRTNWPAIVLQADMLGKMLVGVSPLGERIPPRPSAEERSTRIYRFSDRLNGVKEVFSPGDDLEKKLQRLGDGLGPDAVIAATESEVAISTALSVMRFGTMILFAHTRDRQPLTVDGGAIGKAEKRLIGSYSSSVDLNKEVLDILIDKIFSWEDFITHTFPLEDINKALDLARHPKDNSLKIAVRFPLKKPSYS